MYVKIKINLMIMCVFVFFQTIVIVSSIIEAIVNQLYEKYTIRLPFFNSGQYGDSDNTFIDEHNH